MKKIVFILLMYFLLVMNVKADSINDISMSIYLDEFGTAHVTEIWNVNINKGTEGYKPYYNIGDARFTNFTVSDKTKNYDALPSWNSELSFSDKAYKNGIVYTSNGLELCWGISKYGKNTYTLKYKIEGFVASTNDSDMVYWTLIPYELSSKPKDVKIIINSFEKISDTTPVWGYGNYGGTAYVYDGRIEINSEGTLESDEYMTILAEFPKGMFKTNHILNEDIEYYKDMAEEGSTAYENNDSDSSAISAILWFIIITISAFIPFTKKVITMNSFTKKISKGKFDKDLNYFREIPCNKDIFYAYYLATEYKLIKNTNDFLGALILLWIKKGYVTTKMKEKKGIFKKGEEATLIMHTELFATDNKLEEKMFDYMYEASKDGILESQEFSKYCKTHYSKVLKWFDDVIKKEREKAIISGLIAKEKKTFTSYNETQELYEEAKKLAGLRKFLIDFSSIEDKSAIEVHLWEYYLMYAQIFGIAEEIASEFKKLYPDVINDMTYNDILFIRNMSYNGIKSASNARAASYSSGGGGFSSGGGGGGSFGGGGGGGGFR